MTDQDPAVEGRLLLAIVLSMAVLLLTNYVYQKLYPPPPREQKVQEARKPPQAEEPVVPAAPPVSLGSGDLTATQAESRTIEIENADLVLRWSSRGAVLESVLLKHYFVRGEKEESPGARPERLEMLPQQLPAGSSSSLAIRIEEERLQRTLSEATYEIQGAAGSRLKAPARITFLYRDAQLQVIRSVEVPASGYGLEVKTEVLSGGQPLPFALHLGPGIGNWDAGVDDESREVDEFGNRQIAYRFGNSVTRYDPDDLEGSDELVQVAAQWVALDSQYFTSLIFAPGAIRDLRLQRNDWKRIGLKGREESIPLLSADLGVAGRSRVSLFLGPKDHQVLDNFDASATELIDYGWLAFLVRPLLLSLRFIYQYVNNYGWAIIILTFGINLVLFPLRYKQMASMKKMGEVQPKIKAIQEKYKQMKRDDPRRQKMNTEVMETYKQHGVNPLGGCFPLLIQMPFLIAFYQMLANSIELRAAPFIAWWIPDLSLPDIPLTIIMGVSMFVQQKMTPAASADPMQRRMMMMLPLVFVFMFFSFASGLVLYFLFSNLFAMMLQVLVQKINPALAPKKTGGKKAKGKK